MKQSQTYLNQAFSYNPKSGLLFRNYLGVEHFISNRGYLIHLSRTDPLRPVSGIDKSTGYIQVRLDRKKCYAHRIIWKMIYGEEADTIDHINGNRADNRIENLRSVSQRENCMNSSLGAKNTTGHVGVYRNRSKENPWRVFIKVNGRMISRGAFSTIEQAVSERKLAEVEYGFHAGHGKVTDKNLKPLTIEQLDL